jgi:hypothetical protein
VLAWESLATGVQAQAAAARVPAWTPALARLALALGLALGLLRRMERVP